MTKPNLSVAPLLMACIAIMPRAAEAQSAPSIPVVELPSATTKTASTFGAILGVRELPGGRVLVNDAVRHQLKLLDSALTVLSIPLDSIPGSADSYGMRPLPLVRYLGDSTLTSDADAGTLLLLGPNGKVARALASPYAQSGPPYGNLTSMMGRGTGVDAKGRVIFQGYPDPVKQGISTTDRVAGLSRDSALILRANFETRRVDTVGKVKSGGTMALMGRETPDGPVRVSTMPVNTIDAWGVLSDGSIGIVRGQDYHVDWILPDGSTQSTGKLPFDWKRLTDEDKQRLIDSTRADAEKKMGAALAPRTPPPNADGDGGGGTPGLRVQQRGDQGPPPKPIAVQYIAPELKDMPDYYPALRFGAAMADQDGNLWILPNSSAQSRAGELVYDVVNPKGDFRRVRIPLGRSIAGFGKGGVVFLQSGNRATGFYLERTRLPIR